MLKELVIAIQAYFRAHQFIVKHKLWKWILIPGFIYMLMFMTGIWLFWNSSTTFLDWLFNVVGIKNWLDAMNNSFLNYLFITGTIIVRLILLFFYFSLFKFLFLIIGSPVFAYLSEKTESIIDGVDHPFSMQQLLTDIWRAVRLASDDARHSRRCKLPRPLPLKPHRGRAGICRAAGQRSHELRRENFTPRQSRLHLCRLSFA